LQVEHVRRRAAALTQLFETELLGELLAELDRGAQFSASEEFRAVQTTLAELRVACALTRR
jgi:hypothetical protein